MKLKYFVLILIVLFAIIFILVRNIPLVNSISTKDNLYSKEFGMWVWNDVSTMDDKNRSSLLMFASQNHINTLYIDISNVVDLTDRSDLDQYSAKISNFIKAAKESNIKIEALMGNSSWYSDDEVYIPLQISDWVVNYNKKHIDSKFSGIHSDIEFYNDPNFANDKSLNTKKFLDLYKSINEKISKYQSENNEFYISYDIPYWLNKQDGVVPSIEIQGEQTSVFKAMLESSKDIKNLKFIVMSYRNSANGKNGTINISKDILDTTLPYRNAVVVIGQETNKVGEENISYYGQSKEFFEQQLDLIYEAFSTYENFNGLAIHDYVGFLNL